MELSSRAEYKAPDMTAIPEDSGYFGDAACLRIAHRGGSKRWPENTLYAFDAAYDLGYRWIETDIHLTRDDQIVVFHDAQLERTTNGKGPVSNCTLAELRELDAGYQFTIDGETHPMRGRGLGIPTLEEALDRHPDVHLNLEMKGRDLRLATKLWEFIGAHGVHDRVLAAAAYDPMTAAFRKLAGDRVVTSAGARGIFEFWLAVRTGMHRFVRPAFHALQVPIRHGVLRVVDERFVEAAHAHALKVHVWTVDDPFEMRWLESLGVDGIMTDRPEVLLDTIGL